jgi:hypothetical protein
MPKEANFINKINEMSDYDKDDSKRRNGSDQGFKRN